MADTIEKSHFATGVQALSVRRTGHKALTTEIRNSHRILVSKPKGKKEFGRMRGRQEGNIKTDLKK
jgi:hypothetical protein